MDNELIAVSVLGEAPTLIYGRLAAMRHFERCGLALGSYMGGWSTLDALRGDEAVRRFVEGATSFVMTPGSRLRADVVELPKENK